MLQIRPKPVSKHDINHSVSFKVLKFKRSNITHYVDIDPIQIFTDEVKLGEGIFSKLTGITHSIKL